MNDFLTKSVIKKLFYVAVGLMLTGMVLMIYSKSHAVQKIIQRSVDKHEIRIPSAGRRNAIYLINQLSKSCKPCSMLDRLKKDPSVVITFFLVNDFSENDIANLREAFEIPEKYRVVPIPTEWHYLYQVCNKGKDIPSNILILIDEKGMVVKVRSF